MPSPSQQTLPLYAAPTLPPSSRPRVRCRQITAADAERVVALLTRGFPLRSPDYWRRALAKLGAHQVPAGMPQYGYLIDCGDAIVGVILLVFSSIPNHRAAWIRCNISSWYVEPAFRSHASLLIAHALKFKNVTYVNISPSLHTRPIIEAQGFSRYSSGQFVAAPLLTRQGPPDGATVMDADAPQAVPYGRADLDLLAAHKALGCLAVWCVTSWEAHPFVFLPRAVKGLIPCAQLIYCRHIRDFVRMAAPLGRYLAARGRPLVIIDADGDIPGLVGKYFDGKSPKYFKGPDRPGFGDLAYTEAVLFGL